MMDLFHMSYFPAFGVLFGWIVVNAAYVLILEILPEAGERTEGKWGLQARAVSATITPGHV